MARTTLATDAFTRTDNLDLGSAWDRYTGFDGMRIVGNEVRPDPPAAAVDNFETYNAVTLPNDQWASIKIVTLVSAADTDYLYVGCRWAAPNTASGYMVSANRAGGNPTLDFVKWVAGSPTGLATVNAVGLWAVGDTMLLEVITSGSDAVLTAYINNVQKLTFTDTTSPHASGRAMIGGYNNTAGNAELDDFACGGAAASLLPPPNRFAHMLVR